MQFVTHCAHCSVTNLAIYLKKVVSFKQNLWLVRYIAKENKEQSFEFICNVCRITFEKSNMYRNGIVEEIVQFFGTLSKICITWKRGTLFIFFIRVNTNSVFTSCRRKVVYFDESCLILVEDYKKYRLYKFMGLVTYLHLRVHFILVPVLLEY